MLREEKRWASRLLRSEQISSRDVLFIRQERWRSLLISTLMCVFVFDPVWRFSGKCFFVSFGVDELCCSALRKNPERFHSLNIGWAAVFSGSRLGFVLNSVYLLINRYEGLPRWFRKWVLAKHLNFLEKLIPQLQRTSFLVKQDYFGASSLLVSMSLFLPFHVAGVQHGLMNPVTILQGKVYPGVRTKIEYTYNDFYQDILSQAKHPSANVKVLGPPYDCQMSIGVQSTTRQVIFISSGQMQNAEGRRFVSRIRTCAEEDGLRFRLRPHPSERNEKSLEGYELDASPTSSFFAADSRTTLLVGAFSSLLYQGAFKGFRTVWFLNQCGLDLCDLPYLSDLPNVTHVALENVVPGQFLACFEVERKNFDLDPADVRLSALLKSSFVS